MSEIRKRKKFEYCCPVNGIPKNRDIRKAKETPLFKGFVFVKIRDLQPDELRKINGVVNIIYWLGKPVSVKNGEIKAIRLFLRDYKNITIEKTEIKNNDRIKYT